MEDNDDTGSGQLLWIVPVFASVKNMTKSHGQILMPAQWLKLSIGTMVGMKNSGVM